MASSRKRPSRSSVGVAGVSSLKSSWLSLMLFHFILDFLEGAQHQHAGIVRRHPCPLGYLLEGQPLEEPQPEHQTLPLGQPLERLGQGGVLLAVYGPL